MENKIYAISAEIYSCEFCNTICSKKNDWTRHLQTIKHLRNSGTKMEQVNSACDLVCNCGKKYNTKSGLWKHKKICKVKEEKKQNIQFIKNEPGKNEPGKNEPGKNEPLGTDITFLTNLVLEVVKNNNDLQKQNHELQKQVLDVCKNNSGTYNSHNNSHNKTFNLQFFLNEQCKDAMNIMDFVNSMTLDFSDLEDVGKLGYVEGISGIIIKKLNEMDVYKRPIHCSDGKREIMFVKDDNVWEKENSTYDRIRKAIKHNTKKNGDMMIPWSKKYPACMNIEHRLNDVYVQIMSQCMGGKESFLESENKIMKKIAKAVLIDK